MGEIETAIAEALRAIAAREPMPPAWSDGQGLPWDAPDFSERMLRVHLDETQHASRPAAQRNLIVEWLVAKLGLGDRTYLLDLTCGPGLYAEEVARRGIPVTGIDFSPAAIAHASRTAAVHRLENLASFVLADVRKANLGREAFDAAIMLYGQLTVFRPEETSDLLARVRTALVPGGVFVCEVLDPANIDYEHRTWWNTPTAGIWNDEPHIDFGEHYYDEEARAMVQRHHVVHLANGQLDIVSISDQVYATDELTHMLTEAGFAEVEAYSAWDGLDLPDAGRWIVYVAHVPS